MTDAKRKRFQSGREVLEHYVPSLPRSGRQVKTDWLADHRMQAPRAHTALKKLRKKAGVVAEPNGGDEKSA